MRAIRLTLVAAACAALAACATDGPAGSGASARALLASQVMAPQPHAARGADAAAAVAGYANYQQSYVAPQPQGDSPLVGARK